jgi:hypothetical protein
VKDLAAVQSAYGKVKPKPNSKPAVETPIPETPTTDRAAVLQRIKLRAVK